MLFLFMVNQSRIASLFPYTTLFRSFMRLRGPFQPEPGSILDRVARTRQVSHTADYAAEAVPGPSARFAGARSASSVAHITEHVLQVYIVFYLQHVKTITDKQIELVE